MRTTSDSEDLLQVELSWSEQEPHDLVVNIGVGRIAGPGEGGGEWGRG